MGWLQQSCDGTGCLDEETGRRLEEAGAALLTGGRGAGGGGRGYPWEAFYGWLGLAVTLQQYRACNVRV